LEPRSPFLSLIAWKQRLVFWIGAIVVGLVIVAMTLLSEWAANSYRSLSILYPWFHFVIPPVGLGITAWITFRFFPGSERSGIPQVKTALEIAGNREKLISLRIALGKLLLPIMGLLSGASVGFGGPAVHIGASIMLSLGKAVKFPPHYMERGLIVAGSAAGFAAMFSAPLAGILFAVEEMGRTLEERISSLVLTAIVFSGITAYALLNSYIYFEDELLRMPWGRHWLAIPLCGITGGLLGGLFSKITIAVSRFLNQPATVMISLTMTAYFSGMLQSPLTSFVIVMEMTNSHEIMIPLMATAFFATGTSKLINPVPLYLALCEAYTPSLGSPNITDKN